MAIVQISKIQQRSGNIVDLPQLDEAEFGWASDVKLLFIGKTNPNENVEVLTAYSNISLSQINGANGNMNITGTTLAAGQVLRYDGIDWVNGGGNAGGMVDLGSVSNVKISGGALGYILETDGQGNLSWIPNGVLVSFIENVTQANPAVVTTTQDNYFIEATEITITNVPGMTELNGNTFFVNVISSNSFSLYSDDTLTTPVNSTGYTAFPYTTATATNAVNDRVTVTSSADFSLNDPVTFIGTTFGNIQANTTYYVNALPTGTTIVLSETLGGNALQLTTASGSCTVFGSGGRAIAAPLDNAATAAAGGNTTVQFNASGILGGDSDFTIDVTASPKRLAFTGNANVTGNINVSGNVRGSRLWSNIATGTAPITVTSTTRVANLNVAYANVADFINVTTSTTGTQYLILANALTGNVTETANANLQFNSATGLLTVGNIISNTRMTANAVTITGTASGNSNVSTVTGGIGIKVQSSTYTDNISAASATIPNAAIHGLGTPTLAASNSSVTATNAATLYIQGAPTAGTNMTITNPYALFVAAGNSYFNANVVVGNLLGVFANGNSNISIPSSNGNVNISAVGNANVLVVTGTGANITGTLNATGNANVGNIGAATAVITTGNITTINSGLLQNGNSNVTLTSNSNIDFFIAGNATARMTLTSTGANIAGTANITGNANIGNLGTATAIIATGNITTINSGLLQNGNSNVRIAANSNVGISVEGVSNVLLVTLAGANIAGTANITGAATILGNANIGNVGTNTMIATTGNIGTVNTPLVQSGNSNITLASNSNITMWVAGNANARLNLTTTGANMLGVANIENIESTNAVITVANIPTLNASVVRGGNSNVTFTPNANITFYIAGNANSRFTVTSTGANVRGTLNATGNANLGNLGTATAIITTGNITTINSGLMQSGNSNVAITANGSVRISSTGNANIVIVTGTGVNVAGTANITGTANILGNANIANLETNIATITTGNITTINNGLIQNGNSNIVIEPNGNVRFSVHGSPNVLIVSNPTVTVNGNIAVTANANLSTINSDDATIGNATIGNVTSTKYRSGTSNITINTSSNVDVFVAGNATARARFTSTGLIVRGSFNANGTSTLANAVVQGTANIVTGNIATINSNLLQTTDGNGLVLKGPALKFANKSGVVQASFDDTNFNINTETSIFGNANISSNLTVNNTVTANTANLANINVSNLVISTGNLAVSNLTGVTSIASGTSNIALTPSGNINFFTAGNANARLIVTSTGANVTGTLRSTGNANFANTGTNNFVATNNANVGILRTPTIRLPASNVTNVFLDGGAINFANSLDPSGNYLTIDSANNTVYSSIPGNFDEFTAYTLIGVDGTINFLTASNITANEGNITTVNASYLNAPGGISAPEWNNSTYLQYGKAYWDTFNGMFKINVDTLNYFTPQLEIGAFDTLIHTNITGFGNISISNYSIIAKTAVITTGNITTINSARLQTANANGLVLAGPTVNIRTNANANIAAFATTTSNIFSNLTVTGNITTAANVSAGNLNSTNVTATNATFTNLTATTANLTTVNSSLLKSSNSNITVNPSSFITFGVNNTTMMNVHTTGATVSGTLSVSANANVGNIGANNAVFTTLNIANVNVSNVVSAGNLTLQGTNIILTDGSTTYATFSKSNITSTRTLIQLANIAMGAGTNLTAVDLFSNNIGACTIIATGLATLSGGIISPNISNITNISSGNSNITLAAGGNMSFFIAGNATSRFNVNTLGANVRGTFNVTGNASFGNVSTNNFTATTANVGTVRTSNISPGLGNLDIVFGNTTPFINIGFIDESSGNFLSQATISSLGTAEFGYVITSYLRTAGLLSFQDVFVGNVDYGPANLILEDGYLRIANGGLEADNAYAIFDSVTTNAVVTGYVDTPQIKSSFSDNFVFTNSFINFSNTSTDFIINDSNSNVSRFSVLETGIVVTGNATLAGNVLGNNGNFTTLNSSRWRNGNSNISIAGNANITMFVGGNVNPRLSVTSAGATVVGNLNVSGNASLSGNTSTPSLTASNVSTANLTVSTRSTLGSNSNVIITGGIAGQVLTTDGAGNLSWTTKTTAATLENGNSSVSIAENGNISLNVSGNATPRILATNSGSILTGNVVLETATVSKFIAVSNEGNITATGSNQTNATQLGNTVFHNITGGTFTAGVILPLVPLTESYIQYVRNSTGAAITVYPPIGWQFNNGNSGFNYANVGNGITAQFVSYGNNYYRVT